MSQFISNNIQRETEKAILVAVATYAGQGPSHVKVWFPKSQITIHDDVSLIEVPEWLMKAKGRDIGHVIVAVNPDIAERALAA